jgi:hypothetical protein
MRQGRCGKRLARNIVIVTKHDRRDSRQSRRGTSSDKCQSLMPGKFENGAPDWIRTSDPCLRRAILYPAELRAHIKILPISLATCRSALGHSPVTPLSLRIDRLLEVPDSPDVLANFELQLDCFGGRYSIQLSYWRIARGRDTTRRRQAASSAP